MVLSVVTDAAAAALRFLRLRAFCVAVVVVFFVGVVFGAGFVAVLRAWLPDGYSHIFRSYLFGPSGFLTMAPLRSAA